MTSTEIVPGKSATNLSRAKVLEGIERIETYLYTGDPKCLSMIETMWEWFNNMETNEDGKYLVSVKERLGIFSAFARVSAVKEQAMANRGLKAAPGKVVNNTNYTQINLSVEELNQLPEPIREKLVAAQLKALSGGGDGG